MFLIVKQDTSVIIGSAIKPINIEEASSKGYIICEIPDNEFDPSMLGKKIEEFDNWEN
jgi:hypothetical protein